MVHKTIGYVCSMERIKLDNHGEKFKFIVFNFYHTEMFMIGIFFGIDHGGIKT